MIDNFMAKCVCPIGYSGAECQVTPCSNRKCLNGATCEIEGANANCNCVDGFQGKLEISKILPFFAMVELS